MTYLTTVEVGTRVRMRVGRRWYPGTVTHVGTAYGGTPSAAVDLDDHWLTRHELVHKLRPAVDAHA